MQDRERMARCVHGAVGRPGKSEDRLRYVSAPGKVSI